MNVLLTGGNGFIGSKLTETILKTEKYSSISSAMRIEQSFKSHQNLIPSFNNNSNWSEHLDNIHVVIHLAARTYIMKDEAAHPLAEYRRVNVEGTINLARQAAAAGVRRFIFISSIKVNGEETPLGQPFTADNEPSPEDAYGISKWEAEQGLKQLAVETGMELVIIRPPMVYGLGVKGNFASMIKLLAKGLPLPLGTVHNKRSLVAVDNLVDLIITCIDHPAAANQVFLAGDGQDLSTSELLLGVATAMSAPSRLFPVPSFILIFAATVLGKRQVAQRLFGSLQVDITKTRDLLGWSPPISIDEGLRRCFDSNN